MTSKALQLPFGTSNKNARLCLLISGSSHSFGRTAENRKADRATRWVPTNLPSNQLWHSILLEAGPSDSHNSQNERALEFRTNFANRTLYMRKYPKLSGREISGSRANAGRPQNHEPIRISRGSDRKCWIQFCWHNKSGITHVSWIFSDAFLHGSQRTSLRKCLPRSLHKNEAGSDNGRILNTGSLSIPR